MSPREQKLLTFFAIAGFIVINFLGFSYYSRKRIDVTNQREQARQKLELAMKVTESRDQIADEIDWLAEHEPKPIANQDVQTQLQKLTEKEAQTVGLTIKTQKPLPTDTTGVHYHRAKIQITVTGTEEALYRWFDRLNMPDQFRISSQIRLSPNQQDDTKIDCTATIEQWFVPAAPSA